MRDNAEKTLRRAVVVFLIKNGKICLPKKKFKIGAGKRNGYGGGVEEGGLSRGGTDGLSRSTARRVDGNLQ